jgi:hypothetical protein
LIPVIAQGISILLFTSYGLSCFFSKRMGLEFQRYGLARFRRLTGLLQVAGSLGMIAGQFYRPILLFSAAGLAVMMFLAVLTRFRIQDPLYAALPAFALCILNLYIVATAL